MADDQLPLATYFRGWDRYQELLTTTIAPLSAEQLELRAAPGQRPAWVIAAHIIAARVVWFRRMGEGEASLEPLRMWDGDGQPERSAAELELGLERSWEVIANCLNNWTANDLEQEFIHPRHGALTRQWILWHVLEHDMNHGGELFLTLGIHGLPTPDL